MPTYLILVLLVTAPAVLVFASLNHMLYLFLQIQARRSYLPLGRGVFFSQGIATVVNFFSMAWLARLMQAMAAGTFGGPLLEVAQRLTWPLFLSLAGLLILSAMPRLLRRDEHLF